MEVGRNGWRRLTIRRDEYLDDGDRDKSYQDQYLYHHMPKTLMNDDVLGGSTPVGHKYVRSRNSTIDGVAFSNQRVMAFAYIMSNMPAASTVARKININIATILIKYASYCFRAIWREGNQLSRPLCL
jgi:hypothetical protein